MRSKAPFAIPGSLLDVTLLKLNRGIEEVVHGSVCTEHLQRDGLKQCARMQGDIKGLDIKGLDSRHAVMLPAGDKFLVTWTPILPRQRIAACITAHQHAESISRGRNGMEV